MDKPCLNDKDVYPDDGVLMQHLGSAKNAWDAFMELLKADYPLIATEWRYYNDGKSWLCKATKKAKTICWISVWEKYFRAGFYFNEKAKALIQQSTLDETLKKQYLNYSGKMKIRPVTLIVRKKSDLKMLETLIELKEKVK